MMSHLLSALLKNQMTGAGADALKNLDGEMHESHEHSLLSSLFIMILHVLCGAKP